jgi:hypothetical protein
MFVIGNYPGKRIGDLDSFAVIKTKVKCTCGAVRACAPNPPSGHSDWCDTLHPIEDTEELPF